VTPSSWPARTSTVGTVVDSDVASRFVSGDAEAVRAVYRDYGRMVNCVAFKVLGDRSLAEEATQQAFVQAWRGASNFDPTRDLGPWLATIARRAAIDIFRRESRKEHDLLEDGDAAVVQLPMSAERIYDIWEVRRAIDTLAPEDASVVRLQHLEGMTHTEIAEQLAIPVGTVKSRSFRAHRRLAALLGHLRDTMVEEAQGD
jgi:RNA polymerase sigma factor (sigma-70 family)